MEQISKIYCIVDFESYALAVSKYICDQFVFYKAILN
jgi:hypothetical protein